MSGLALLFVLVVWGALSWRFSKALQRFVGTERFASQSVRVGIAGILATIWVGSSFWYAGGRKLYYDEELYRLCQVDAVVMVYETVTLPPEMFDQWGDPFPGWRGRQFEDRLGNEYRYVMGISDLKKGDAFAGDIELRRYTFEIFRRSDKKLMGRAISYGRSGGDFIAIAHPTSKSCPADQSETDLIRSVFVMKRR